MGFGEFGRKTNEARAGEIAAGAWPAHLFNSDYRLTDRNANEIFQSFCVISFASRQRFAPKAFAKGRLIDANAAKRDRRTILHRRVAAKMTNFRVVRNKGGKSIRDTQYGRNQRRVITAFGQVVCIDGHGHHRLLTSIGITLALYNRVRGW